jgi:RNA polymerase sigma-70 factor (ECF subfamily)
MAQSRRFFYGRAWMVMAISSGRTDLDSARRAKLAEALVQSGRGDRNALATVFAATSAKLFGVCLHIFPDRNEAEDVL